MHHINQNRTGQPCGQRGYLRDLHAVILLEIGLYRLQRSLRARAPDATCGTPPELRQLGSASVTLAGARSISCRILDQQISRLKQELEMDDGFYRTPLVHDRLKAPQ
jgi:hypothetical protein